MIARILSCLIGIWLMAAPAVLGYRGPARLNDQTVGPLIASFAIVAAWEATRGLRWANLLLGFWLMLAPLVLHYPTWPPAVNSVLCSLVTVLCSLQPGKRSHRYNGGWPKLFS